MPTLSGKRWRTHAVDGSSLNVAIGTHAASACGSDLRSEALRTGRRQKGPASGGRHCGRRCNTGSGGRGIVPHGRQAHVGSTRVVLSASCLSDREDDRGQPSDCERKRSLARRQGRGLFHAPTALSDYSGLSVRRLPTYLSQAVRPLPHLAWGEDSRKRVGVRRLDLSLQGLRPRSAA